MSILPPKFKVENSAQKNLKIDRRLDIKQALREDLAVHKLDMQQSFSAIENKTDFDQLILPKWRKMRSIASMMNELKLSGPKAKARSYIVDLVYLQAEKFELIARSIEEDSEEHEERLRQIDTLLSDYQRFE